MSIEYKIRDLALANPTIAGTLGARWYPNPLPQSVTYPALGYQQISQVNHSSHEGSSHLATTRLQLDLWAPKHTDLTTLRDNLLLVLRDFKGIVGGVRIDRIKIENDSSFVEPDTNIQRRIIELLIWHYVQY